ncbi:MAG: TonB-dependent receptor, partial [Bacteroidales bacterium]
MKKSVLIVFLCVLSVFATGKGRVKGLVTNKNSQGILNVAIILDGGKTGAATNADGSYSFEIAPGEYEITFSHVQYKSLTKKIRVKEGEILDVRVSLEEAVFNLDQVSVTGSATEMELKKLPSSICVITTASPEFRGVTTIDDVLSRVPGIFVDRSRGLTTTGSHTSVSLRGTAATNRTLVMKDGIPLNNAYTGSVTEWNTMASNSISRIEVVRGAASSLYGTNAMGGVINMITEIPQKQPVLEAGAKYGSINNAVFNLKAGKAFDNGFGFMLFSEYKQTDGYRYMDRSLWKNYYKKPTNEMLNITAKAVYHFKNASLLEFIGDFHQEKPETGTTTIYDANNKVGNFLLRYKTKTGRFGWNLTTYTNRSKNETDAVKWNETTSAFDKSYYSTDVPYHENGIVGKINTVTGQHTVTLGVDLRLYDLESDYDYAGKGTRQYEGQQLFYSAFVNDEIALGKKVNASLGVRYDYWRNRDGKFSDNTSGEQVNISYPKKTSHAVSPKVGLVYRISERYRLRTSFSTGFKAPSMYYLYRSAPHGTTTFDLGNPDLDPERMTYSCEAGGDFYLNDKLELSATYYISRFKDFLDKINVSQENV